MHIIYKKDQSSIMYRSLSLTFCALTILHTVCATPMLPLMQSYAAIQHSDNTHAAIHSFANDYKDNKHAMLDKNDLVFNTMFAVSESQDDTHANDDSNHKKNRQGTFKKEDLVTNPVAADSLYAGLGTFSHLPYVQCLQNDSLAYDIAFIGAPFDSGKSISFSYCQLLNLSYESRCQLQTWSTIWSCGNP